MMVSLGVFRFYVQQVNFSDAATHPQIWNVFCRESWFVVSKPLFRADARGPPWRTAVSLTGQGPWQRRDQANKKAPPQGGSQPVAANAVI